MVSSENRPPGSRSYRKAGGFASPGQVRIKQYVTAVVYWLSSCCVLQRIWLQCCRLEIGSRVTGEIASVGAMPADSLICVHSNHIYVSDSYVLLSSCGSCAFPVHPRGRGPGGGQPVEGDVVEDAVPRGPPAGFPSTKAWVIFS